jgi:NAD+ kinase
MLELKSNEKVTIRKFDKPLRLLHPAGHDHYKVLRTKLGWGSHPKTL